MGFGMAVTTIIKHTEFFGGRMGLQAPKLYLFDTALKDIHFYYIIAGVAVVLAIAAIKLFKTKVGRAFIAIRDSDIAAETMGVNLSYYKTLAFAVSAFYTGIAGGLYAFILDSSTRRVFTSSCPSPSWPWWWSGASGPSWGPSPAPSS